ncbi:MAG: SIR2 family protein [Clostridium sp.]|nr:SIR2 family protein [Clostridium sp.]
MISKGDFINIICDAKKENNVSIFVGAGLCSDAKMPDWLHLLKPCADELKISIDERTDLFKFAQYYANKFGYNKLRKIINKSLNTYQHDSILVSSILCVGFNSIWTTNYDRIIENSLIDMNSSSNTIFDEKDLVNITWQNRINIFKLNGDINNLDNIVITQNDIDNYASRHALFLTFLKRELVTNTFVFVGYSFNDKIILSALAEINTCLGDSANTHYAIMKNKHTSEFNMFIDDLYKRYHIQTYLVEDYCEIPILFNQIHENVLKKNVFISGSFESLNSNENNFAYYVMQILG